MAIERFEDLKCWRAARELCRKIYSVSQEGNFSRDFTLCEQMRRAAISAVSNIADGFDSGSEREFLRFLRYSQRSCSEIRAQLYVALDQGYLEPKESGLSAPSSITTYHVLSTKGP
ncbi:MAG: four helix bundle protein [Opitutales bacterium]